MNIEPSLLLNSLDSMRDLVLIKGPKSRLIWANKAFRDYYGMSEAALRDIVDGPQSDPDDTLQYVRDDELVFSSGNHVDVPAEVVTDVEGVARLFHTVKSPMHIDGELAMSVGVSRRHEDPELQVSKSHMEAKELTRPLRLLTSAFPLALAVVDMRGRVVTTSPEWVELFGATDDGSATFFGEAYRGLSELDQDLRSAFVDGASVSRRLRPEALGLAGEYEFRIGPWGYDDGTRGGVLILALDVTTEADQRASLEEANRRYDLVLEGASVGIWDWVDVNGDEEYWSPRFLELLGYGPGEIEASLSAFGDLLHPDDTDRTFALVDAHFESGEPFDLEYRLRTKSAGYRWYQGRGVADRNEHGEPTRMVGSIQDIDQRVRAERDLRRVNEDLEHFAHIAAHDLREPARRQQMLIDLLIDDHGADLSPEVLKELEAIKGQSQSMLAMLNAFRRLSGLAGPNVEREIIDLAALTRRVVDQAGQDADTSDVTIELPEKVEVYSSLVKLLLQNLTNNALTHGVRPLSLKFTSHQNGDAMVFRVSNTWNGNPSVITRDIFKPFVTTSGDGSSGLGLSICKRVIDHHRGWIDVHAEDGKFTIEFTLGAT